jgi:tripartite-type tricarboxylate transporter receptor subunit TctC
MGIAWKTLTAWMLCVAGLASIHSAHAEDASAFYSGRNLNLLEGFNVGGGADTYTRLIAKHLAEHIAGHPNIIVHNMPGAGSIVAANHVFNVSPRDGSEFGLFGGNTAVDPVIGGMPTQFDSTKFNWIGAPAAESSVCLASKTTSFKTFNDVLTREMVTGTAGTSTYDYPMVLNSLLGAKLKLVKGYNGSSSLRLALERGEIEGFCGVGLASLRSLGLIDKINILVQTSLKSDPQLTDVPLIVAYAKSEEDRQVMRLIFGWLVMDRPIAAPPDTPQDRVAALRDGFDATMSDPQFIADISNASLTYSPMSGKDIAKFIDEVYRTPPDVAKRAAQLLGRTSP